MRCIVVGYGIQGRKRWMSLGEDCEGIVEPDRKNSVAPWTDVRDVPLDAYDAAMVCVPPDEKPAIIDYLLANKKHMLVEKPLLASDEWLSGLDACCKTAGIVCYVAYNHRFEPMIVKLKELIDSGDLGKLYHCRMFYGNGTAEDVRKSPWRDSGKYGVMAEIGTHLIDLSPYLFGGENGSYREWRLVRSARYENRGSDHAIFTRGVQPFVECEVTYLSWKNTFTIDLIGEKGSAHLDGLTKWGASRLTQRWRLSPPGVPFELELMTKRPDVTWELEYDHFRALCFQHVSARPGLARDRMINKTLGALMTGNRT